MTAGVPLQLAIIGAGPFGLSAAAMAKARGLNVAVFGKPMELWRNHMPERMLLRSDKDWHLDPCERHTLARFLTTADPGRTENTPIPIERFLEYAAWFREQAGIEVDARFVTRLTRNRPLFEIELEDGDRVSARQVLCAPGVRYFRQIPAEYTDGLPGDRWCHSTDVQVLDRFRGRRCLIVGGRQSAYELGTLLERHAGADVTIVHRHAAPSFQESDWSWVADQVRRAEQTPGWFAQLQDGEQEAIRQRFWSEGRLKLEPWLGERLRDSAIVVLSNTRIAEIAQENGQLTVRLSDGAALPHIDVVILATGFKVDLRSIPYLDPALLASVACADGYPVLDDTFQSASVPGLAFAGLVAARDFGPFLGFLVSCPFAGRRAVAGIEARLRGGEPRLTLTPSA